MRVCVSLLIAAATAASTASGPAFGAKPAFAFAIALAIAVLMLERSVADRSTAAPTVDADRAIAPTLNIAIAANFASCVLVFLMSTPKNVRQATLACTATLKRHSRVVAYAYCPEDSRLLKKKLSGSNQIGNARTCKKHCRKARLC